MLAVGVHRDDEARARRERQPVAGAKRSSLAAVQREVHRGCSRGSGALHRVVGRAVVHDDRVKAEARDLGRQAPEDLHDVPRLVVGGDDHRDPAGELVDVRSRAELVQGEVLDQPRQVATRPLLA